MASLNMAMYDYDGAVFAFGVVRGLYSVASVRMYISIGTGTTYHYYSTEIYTQAEGHLNTLQNPPPCYAFYIRTDRDAEGSYPKQLEYWLLDENGDGYGRYKVGFHFYDSSGNLLNTTPLRPSVGNYSDVYYQMHNKLDSPSISYDTAKKSLTVSGVPYRSGTRLMVELVRKDRNKTNIGFSSDVRDYAYTVLMKNFERGKYWEAFPCTSWYGEKDGDSKALSRFLCDYPNIRALIVFDSGASWGNEKQTCVDIATQSLNQLSTLTGINFTTIDVMDSNNYDANDSIRTAELQSETWGPNSSSLSEDQLYRIIIRFCKATTTNEDDFPGEGRWFAFSWSEDDYASWGVASGHPMIKVDESISVESLNHVIHEEICQSLGVGGDNYWYLNSIHADPEYCNPETYIGLDASILQFIYSKCQSGWDPIDFINQVDTPCVLFAECDGSGTYEFDLSRLSGDTYYASAWVAQEKSNPGDVGTSTASHGTNGGGSEFYYWNGGWDDSPYSIKTTIEFVHNGLKKWDWNASNGSATASQTKNAYAAVTGQGPTIDFPYLVWNDLVNMINDVATAAGSSWNTMYATYDATKMTPSDKTLTAKRFNAARQNIGSRVSTGINEVSTGDIVYGHYFTTLTDKLNQWISQL